MQLEDLQAKGDYRANEILERRDELRQQISVSKDLYNRIQTLEKQVTGHRNNLGRALEDAARKFGLAQPGTVESLRGYVAETDNVCKNMQNAVESQAEALKTWEGRIENTKREIQFHEMRLRKERVQRLHDVRYEALHDSLKDLGDLRDIADDTKSLLNSQLHDRLEKELPPVAEEMTEVYLRLTGSPTFDSIGIRQGENIDGSMTLDLRVSSSRGPGTWRVDQGILNGQASNAIQLVPYFVFSRYQDSPLLDLLLLDDPTQAFDTSKIKLLLTELFDATSHATLFVATHEEDRFVPVLNELFGADHVRAYRALGIGEDGPRFEDVPVGI